MNNVLSYVNNLVHNQAVFDLGRSSRQQAESVAKIASGSRLANASEDPGATAVSLSLRFSTKALDGVEKGLMGAQSFLHAQADGLRRIGEAAERMSEIAARIQDPTMTNEDADAGIQEINALREEIVRAQGETLNGQKLFVNFLGDTVDPLNIALGENGQTLALSRADFSAGDFSNAWIFALGNQAPYVGIGTENREGLAVFGGAGFDTLLQSVSEMLARNGADLARVESALEQARTRRINLDAAEGRVSDVEVAREVTRLGRTNIQMDAARAVLTQANVFGEMALKLLGG